MWQRDESLSRKLNLNVQDVEKMTKYPQHYTTQTIRTSALDVLDGNESLQDQPGEARFLASVMQYGLDAYIEIEGIVTEESFTDEANQMIWKCIVNLFETEVTKPTLSTIINYADALGFKNFFEKKEEKDYLKGLFHLPVEIQDCRIIGAQLRKLQIKRELFSRLKVASNNLFDTSTLDPLSKLISNVQSPIEEYLMKLTAVTDEGGRLTDGMDIYLQNLFANPDTICGYKTGFNKYDEFAGGSLEPETLHVIVARAKVGKSSFALNTAINLSKIGVYSIIADYEMSKQKWLNRFLSNLTGISIRKFKHSQFSEEEKDLINDAQKIIKDYPIIYVNINGKSVDEALYNVKRLLNKNVGKNAAGKYDCLFIYDYLRLNDTADIAKNMQEYQALGFQAIKLKNFGIQNKIPTLTFVQANRGGIDTEDTSVASGSDRVLWLCDSMALFKRKSPEERIEDRAAGRDFNRKLVFLESRDGAEVEEGTYVNYNFEGEIARITEGPSNVELRTKKTIKVDENDKKQEF